MVLLYAPRKSNRIQYIAKLILKEICGFEYAVTSSPEKFINFKGARINYSGKKFPDDSINIYPSGFLLEKGIREFTPNFFQNHNNPVLFPEPKDSGHCDLGYDIFSSSFYLVSRYEEYLPYLEDRYGRFEADQSFAFQHNFLETPLVDVQALELRQKILERFPATPFVQKQFSFIPTYDIDVAYAYKGRGVTRNLLAFIKDIFTLDFSNFRQRILVLSGKNPDPYDSYEFQLELQKKYKLHPVYFFLAAQYGPYDRNISIYSQQFHLLLKRLGDYAETGLHPSFASHQKPGKLLDEIKTVAATLNRTVENSRQHFLKIHFPDTYLNLIRYNILRDFSMGFASHTGFRAGTCTPFNFYNLPEETETRLKIYPLAVMDGTLKDYMNLSRKEALAKSVELAEKVKKVNGTFISLWHNDTLSNTGAWQGWQEVYTEMLEQICFGGSTGIKPNISAEAISGHVDKNTNNRTAQ